MLRSEILDLLEAVSRLLGWIYFICWSASFYPQPIVNYQRRSTHGLAIDFPTINILGFISYAISTSAFLYSPLIRSQYAARHPMSPEPTVRSNDLAFAVHAIVLSGLTYTQFWPLLWGFDVGSRQRVSAPIAGIFWGSLVGVALVIIIIASKGGNCGEDASSWAWIDAIYAIGYVKLIITMVKYVPQAWVNYKRKSTAGWSIYQILFDFTGGILSILQLVIDASLQDDWSGITGNPVKLGLGNISIFWNIIFIVQHYWLYHIKEEEKAVVQSTNGEQQPLLATRDEERANST